MSREVQLEPFAGDLGGIVPLQLKRSKAGIIAVTVLMLGMVGFVIVMGGGSRVLIRLPIVLLLLAACIQRVRSSRYLIEIDERGLFDGAARPKRIAWSEIADISCDSNGDYSSVILKLKTAPDDEVRIQLAGVQTPVQGVMSSTMAYWHAARRKSARR